jgi:hypothetical protein
MQQKTSDASSALHESGLRLNKTRARPMFRLQPPSRAVRQSGLRCNDLGAVIGKFGVVREHRP